MLCCRKIQKMPMQTRSAQAYYYEKKVFKFISFVLFSFQEQS